MHPNQQPLALLLAQANEFKEGDVCIGGTTDNALRTQARELLGAFTVGDFAKQVLIEDLMSEWLAGDVNSDLARAISDLSLWQVKANLLGGDTKGSTLTAASGVVSDVSWGASWARKYRDGLSSETIAALAKVMSNEELGIVARNLADGTTLGSRIQPNSPSDNEDEILLSTLEGLCYGCGDVVLGLNPASDDLPTIVRCEQLLASIVQRLQLPTRWCVLSDMVKQNEARVYGGVDVGFQSLAGTSKALVGMLGCDVDGLLDLCRNFNGLYFETGQGSEVTNGAHLGVDMVTLESRCYGLARLLQKRTGKFTIVNDVAGFIGPEVFRTPAQLERACLEDTFMARMHGLRFGLDVCSTFHMGIHPEALRQLTERITAQAWPSYLMAVAGKADPMLGYLTTSFAEHPQLRRITGRGMAPAMRERLVALGVLDANSIERPSANRTAMLYAMYHKAGGHSATLETLEQEGLRKLANLREQGWELGANMDNSAKRLDTLFNNARQALFAQIEPAVLRDACLQPISVRTLSRDRDHYLAAPVTGEQLHLDSVQTLARLPSSPILLVISDGLDANAVNQHLRHILPPLRRELNALSTTVSPFEIVINNGRVRAGYHVAQILSPQLLVHLIGERPGTGLDQLSAYITYAPRLGFSPAMDHSVTSAVCGIHPNGRSYAMAINAILNICANALRQQFTGVAPATRQPE